MPFRKECLARASDLLVADVVFDDMDPEQDVIGRILIAIVFYQFKLKEGDCLVFPFLRWGFGGLDRAVLG